jgi:hypothetical protein
MLKNYLNITDAQVRRTLSTSDGMGGTSVTTALTTLSACAIWENGLGGRFQRITIGGPLNISSHTLVLEPGAYSWNINDTHVLHNGYEYRIVGVPSENTMGLDIITIVGLEVVK